MLCPTLKDLPPPPKDKTGWPWTEESPRLTPLMSDSSEWPTISIVTPSYNYARFIEETIRSVLLQGYPNIEYIIIDGKSSDNSAEIIRRYEKYLKFWTSEPDRGFGDAINKGYRYHTGRLFTWIGADDSFEPGCFKDVAELHLQGYQFIIGECLNITLNEDFKIIEEIRHSSVPQTFDQYIEWWSHKYIPQPSAFMTKNLSDKALPLDSRILMDFGFFLRVMKQNPYSIWTPKLWTKARFHGKNISRGPIILNNYLSMHEIAVEEAVKAYGPWKRLIFRIKSSDNLLFFKLLLARDNDLTVIRLLKILASWPFVIRRPIFLKMFLRACIGEEKYLMLKKLIKRPSSI